MDPHNPSEETPIISLDEVRQRRQAEAEQNERTHRLGTQFAWQRRTLTQLILDKKLDFATIQDMLRLCIVAESEAWLPCGEIQRTEDYDQWAQRFYNLIAGVEDQAPAD